MEKSLRSKLSMISSISKAVCVQFTMRTIKFCSAYSSTDKNNVDVCCHVRQGSVLSPFLFAIYVDDFCALCKQGSNLYIIVYADDILLLAPTLTALEKLLHACERELIWLDMLINCKKSFCLRVGQRCDAVCANVVNYFCGQSIL